MLKHVVMWRFAEGAEGKSREAHACWMKEHLEALVGIVLEIISLEVGVDHGHGPMSYDAVLTVCFADREAMQRYKGHPAHQAVSNYCKKVRESRTVVDYDVNE